MPSPNTLADRIAHKLVRSFPSRLVDVVPERTIVSFSFDDVPESALRHGARILEAHGVRGTFYIAGGIAGQAYDGQNMLDEAGHRALAAAGHEIGHHTFSHRAPMLLGRQYAADLARNDAYLSPIIGGYARNFAYPFGRSSLGARKLLSRRFRSNRGIETGVNRGRVDLDLLQAVEMRSETGIESLTGWIDAAVDDSAWIIYFTHDVQDEPTEYGTRPDLLDRLVGHAIAAGAEVLTVDAALDRLEIDL